MEVAVDRKKRIIVWVIGTVLLLGGITSIIFYKVEEAYDNAVYQAKSALENGDFNQAYDAISKKSPKRKDEELFDKVKLITFSKLFLAKDFDLDPPLGGEPKYEEILERLLRGISDIDSNFHRAVELKVSSDLQTVRSEYIIQLEDIFGLSNYEIEQVLALSDKEKLEKIKVLAQKGKEIASQKHEEELDQLLKEANPIEITDKKASRDGDYMYASGAVKNVSQTSYSYIKVKVTYVNDSGDIIDTDWTYASSETLRPNEQKYFEIMTRYRDGMSKYSIVVESYK